MDHKRFTIGVLEANAEFEGQQYTEESLKNVVDDLSDCLIRESFFLSDERKTGNVVGYVDDAWFEDGILMASVLIEEESAEVLEEGLVDIAPTVIHNLQGRIESFEGLFFAPETTNVVPGIME